MTRIPLARSGPAVAAVSVVLVAAACGASHGSSSATSGSAAHNMGQTTATRTTSIGKVMTTSSGRTIYELVGDPASNSKCTGTCLSLWPAVMSNGKQLVVNGHPAFTYAGDSGAGQTNGQGRKDQWGLWLALTPTGTAIQNGATPGSGSPSMTPSGGNSSGSGGGSGGSGSTWG